MQGLTGGIPDRIDKVVDCSDRFVSRILVSFSNGYKLSIIRGDMSYGGASGLFEIAIIDNLGEFCTKRINRLRFCESLNGDVIGWLSEDEVKGWVIYVANLPMEVMR